MHVIRTCVKVYELVYLYDTNVWLINRGKLQHGHRKEIRVHVIRKCIKVYELVYLCNTNVWLINRVDS